MTRILVCIRNGRDREHLAEWLRDDYEVTVAEHEVPADVGFDLYVLDAAALETNRPRITSLRDDERPVFLPFLLVARRRQVVRDRGQLLSAVDEVIWAPVARMELSARIRALLRIRNLGRLVQQRYLSLANQSAAGVLLVRAGRIHYANEAARTTFADVAEGSAVTELVAPSHRPLFEHYLARVAARARGEPHAVIPTHVELLLNTDGEHWAHASATPTVEADDREFLVTLLDVTESKRAERALRESRSRIELLAGQLVSVEQRERSVLAGAIHDGVNQSLASLRMRLDLLAKAREKLDVDEEIGDMRRILDEAISQVRNLIVELDPPTLRESGLSATLSWLVEQFRERHGLDAHFEDGIGEPVDLSGDLQHVLYRATRELLFNAVKHAPGARARVAIESAEAHIAVRVTDDGPGFDPEAVHTGSGFGLFSLRERLRPFGGTVEIRSAPGKGTVVEQRVPYPWEEEQEHEKAHTAG